MGAAQNENWLGNWYSNTIRKMNRPASEISGSEAMAAIGQAITSGYKKVQNMIGNITPEYVRGVREGKLLTNIYSGLGVADISDFEVLDKALNGVYGPALQKLAQQKENQLTSALAGEGFT